MAQQRVGTGLLAILSAILCLTAAAPAGADCAAGPGLCRRQSLPGLSLARSEAGHVYGALAYSKRNGAFGWSTGFGDSDSANDYALEKCAQRGAGCYVVISFSNLCASVSADDEGGVFWGTAGTRLEAQRQSQLYCNRNGSPNCEVKVWACSMP